MIRAVICDDEKAALNIIRHFIENENLPIEIVGTAEDGNQALELISREKPNLVFMDNQMPFMDGFEVMKRIRDTKVIIVTAYDSFEYAQRALRLGACDIILKPIELAQLKNAVTRAVGWNFTGNKTINCVLEYIHKNYNQKIDLDTLAQIAYCTQSHLAHQFKKHVGMTIMSYVHKIRIEAAANLLREQENSIQEIAELVGYQNLNNFYKYFKLYMNDTPAVYVQKFGRNHRLSTDTEEEGWSK